MNNGSSSSESRRKTSFASDVLKLVSGTVFAQILTIAITPLITRLYGPEAFGLSAVFISISYTISTISCLRYELAILLPKTDEEASNLLAISLGFVCLISTTTVPIVWLEKSNILNLLQAPGLDLYLWLIPPSIFFSGTILALNYWNSRTKHFARLSIAQGLQAVGTSTSQLGMGYAGHRSAGSLIEGTIAGSALSSVILIAQILHQDSKLFRNSIRWKNIEKGLRSYARFPLYNTWSALLNTISWQLPALLLSAFFSASVVGYYALAYRIMNLPMIFIGRAIGQVFLQRASIAKYNGTLNKLVEKTISNLSQLLIFPLLTLIAVGHDLIVLVFGKNWGESGIYLQILGIWAIIWLITSPIDDLFQVLGRQKEALYIQVIIFVSRLLALVTGGYTGSARITLLFFSVSGALVYAYSLVRLIRIANANLSSIVKKFLLEMIAFLPIGFLTVTMHLFKFNPIPIIIVNLVAVSIHFYSKLKHMIPLFEK